MTIDLYDFPSGVRSGSVERSRSAASAIGVVSDESVATPASVASPVETPSEDSPTVTEATVTSASSATETATTRARELIGTGTPSKRPS